MFTTPSTFMYGMNIKMNLIPHTTLGALFPSIEDFVVQSRSFDTADVAVASASGIMADVINQINEVSETQYKQFMELNPKLSGKETISKEWGAHEVAKLWMIPASTDLESNATISPPGLAQIVEVQAAPVLTS